MNLQRPEPGSGGQCCEDWAFLSPPWRPSGGNTSHCEPRTLVRGQAALRQMGRIAAKRGLLPRSRADYPFAAAQLACQPRKTGTHGLQCLDLLVDGFDPLLRHAEKFRHLGDFSLPCGGRLREGAMQLLKLSDFAKRKSKMLALLDEANRLQVAFVVLAITGRVPRRLAQQSLALVKAQCLDVHADALILRFA